MIFQIGQVLYGYCGGVFGRDSYEDKRIEAIGVDWLVVRGVDSGKPDFAHVKPEDAQQLLDNSESWRKSQEEFQQPRPRIPIGDSPTKRVVRRPRE